MKDFQFIAALDKPALFNKGKQLGWGTRNALHSAPEGRLLVLQVLFASYLPRTQFRQPTIQ